MDPSRKGFPAQVDARSDVFSLGVMLCEVLTGEHPLGPLEKKDTYEDLRQWLLERQEKGIRVDWSKNPRVDSRTRQLLDRCLAYRPEDRPQTAAEVAKGLRYSLLPYQRLRRWASLNVRLLVASAAVLGALLFVGVSWSIPKDPYSVRQFNKGMNSYRQGRIDEASEYFSRAVRADPQFVDALFAQGRTFQRLNQFGPAEEAFLAAERLRPEGRIEACLGYCSAKLEHFEVAIAQSNAAIKEGFKTAEVLNNRGYSRLQQRHLDNAENDFVEVIRLGNSPQAPHYNLALLELTRAYEKQDHKSACLKGLEHIQRCLEIGPERADLYYTGAKLYSFAAERDTSLVDPAIDFLRNAIRLGLPRSRFEADFAGFKGIIENPRVKQLAGSAVSQSEPEGTPRLLNPIHDE
jgi:tetratricopeptide (TPR) repeat protein